MQKRKNRKCRPRKIQRAEDRERRVQVSNEAEVETREIQQKAERKRESRQAEQVRKSVESKLVPEKRQENVYPERRTAEKRRQRTVSQAGRKRCIQPPEGRQVRKIQNEKQRTEPGILPVQVQEKRAQCESSVAGVREKIPPERERENSRNGRDHVPSIAVNPGRKKRNLNAVAGRKAGSGVETQIPGRCRKQEVTQAGGSRKPPENPGTSR